MKTRKENIYDLISAERNHQDKKWGLIERRFRDISKDRWMTVLAEEVGEVANRVQDGNDRERFRELVQVAAVAVVTLEAIILEYNDIMNDDACEYERGESDRLIMTAEEYADERKKGL